jgi:hypothetical protein
MRHVAMTVPSIIDFGIYAWMGGFQEAAGEIILLRKDIIGMSR